MKQKQAEVIAIQALGWLAAEDDLMGVFLAATGVSINSLAESAADPAFLIGVLDFLMLDDAHVMRFCDSAGLPYGAPMQARQVLPGGEMVHWT